MSVDVAASFCDSFVQTLPTATELDAMLTGESWRRECVPLEGNRLAAPFDFTWREGVLEIAHFEFYDEDSPLGAVTIELYQNFLRRPEAASVRRLVVGNVACQEFRNSQLLDDPVDILVRIGLPPNLEMLEFARIGPISNAGDVGYYGTNKLAKLLPKLVNLVDLEMPGCQALGKLDLPKLRRFRLHNEVTVKNLKEITRAQWPSLERLELEHDAFATIENRFKAFRALLRSKGFPKLRHLEIEGLDLDEDQRLELDDDEDAEADPDSWVDMIADSLVLKKLCTLRLSFRDDERELPRLVERAEAFQHLQALEFWGGRGQTRLEFPTREAIEAALTR